MEILSGVQPNCSELVVRLGDISHEETMESLKSIGIEEYMIRNRYGQEEKNDGWDGENNWPRRILMSELGKEVIEAWDIAHNGKDPKLVTKAKKLLAKNGLEVYRDSITLSDSQVEAKDWDPGLWIGGDPYDEGITAIWYHQHCQAQGFPMLKKIADHFGAFVEAHDGGDIQDYNNWLLEYE